MKTLLTITLTLIIGFIYSSTAFANHKTDFVYNSKIDQTVSFYKARLYLTDSEYKILSDIGQDAQKMINFIQINREQLIKEMTAKQNYKSAKIRSHIVNRARSYVTYGNKIDQMVSFYQARLYLTDSEYKILSDIGQDAQKMINFLQTRKDQLVKEMEDKKVGFQLAKVRAYVVNRARLAGTDIEYLGYLTPRR
jgi:hypothetical protein